MPVLSLLHLRAAIGARDLFHIDLAQLPRGRRAALVGPNGVGKSTLLQAIWRAHAAGASGHGRDGVAPDPPDSPVAYFGDIVLERGASLAYLPQRPPDSGTPLPPALRARWELPDRPLGLLSAGQRTRAALAAALAQAPELLLLDEPTNHLDLWLREAVDAALARFPGAVVLATHDRWLVAHWAEEEWRVEGGALRRVDGGRPGAGADGPVPAGGVQAPATGAAEGGDAAGDLVRRMRLAELTARLADPRVARRPAERAALEEELGRLSQPPQGG